MLLFFTNLKRQTKSFSDSGWNNSYFAEFTTHIDFILIHRYVDVFKVDGTVDYKSLGEDFLNKKNSLMAQYKENINNVSNLTSIKY